MKDSQLLYTPSSSVPLAYFILLIRKAVEDDITGATFCRDDTRWEADRRVKNRPERKKYKEGEMR